MKTRPRRPGITAAARMYEELDRNRELLDEIGETIGIAYRDKYKISDAAALPPLHKCVFKLIADSNYTETCLNIKLAEYRLSIKMLRVAVISFVFVILAESIWIWALLLGGRK